MDRREAMLRELNLYPLWQRRGGSAPVVAEQPVPVAAALEPATQVEPDALVVPAARVVQVPRVVPDTPASLAPRAPDGIAGHSAIPARGDSRTAGGSVGGRGESSGAGWPQLRQEVRDCAACKLRAGCTQTVFGVGDQQADWLFVGEGPGADEDAQGEPFVGQAGKLLDNMLMAIKLRRGKNVYIANIVKCRPPNNRTPEADEIAACLPHLKRQIDLVRPKLIVALGKTASTALLGRDAPLGSLRGKLHDFKLPATEFSGAQEQESSQPSSLPHQPTSSHRIGTIPLVVTYHPAYLLRSPPEKAKAWHDLCFAADSMQKL